jgi:ribosomal protein L11 methyltransferase
MNNMKIDNPFQQNPVTYCLQLKIKYQYLDPFIIFCETLSDSIVYFEAEDTKSIDSKPEDLWQIDVYLDKKPDIEKLEEEFNAIAKLYNIAAPECNLVPVVDKDWVSEVQKTFIPIESGKFFIHHSGFEGSIPKNLINIEINAGRAFGTGEHETTSNCLKALSEVEKADVALDVGCGSGILAIAMAKLGFEKVIAVDLDIQAVLVTKENIHLNKIDSVMVGQSDGYQSELVSLHSPYKIITANILAAPLIGMAKDAASHLAEGGKLILAGFLKDQQQNILSAYQELGLKLLKEICIENWPVIVMTKISEK